MSKNANKNMLSPWRMYFDVLVTLLIDLYGVEFCFSLLLNTSSSVRDLIFAPVDYTVLA